MILFLSSRYSFSRTSGHRSRAMRIALATALSLAVLMVTISVMEYLQNGRFERIRDIQSFDITIAGDCTAEMREAFPDASVFLYGESEALALGNAYTVRYIDSSYDGSLIIGEGDASTLLVPYSLYFRTADGSLEIVMMKEGRSGMKLPSAERVPISGAYYTALGSSFDNSTLFMPLPDEMNDIELFTAVKGVEASNAERLRDEGYDCLSWKEKEAGLYAAFAAEKAMMYVVLSLLFVIILVSLKSNVRVFFRARTGEWAELRALGIGKADVRAVFLFSFMLIALLGIVLGLVFTALMIPLGRSFVLYLTGARPELALPYSLFFVFSLLIIAFTVLFAWLEARKTEKLEIAEVLADEAAGA